MRRGLKRWLVSVVTIAFALAASAAPAGSQSEDVVVSYDLTLDKRCHVAVLRATLSRPAFAGIIVQRSRRFVGRVPFGPVRAAASSGQAINVTFIWDLEVEERYLEPGRYTTVFRALNRRGRVLDKSEPVEFKVPRSFTSPPTDCGE